MVLALFLVCVSLVRCDFSYYHHFVDERRHNFVSTAKWKKKSLDYIVVYSFFSCVKFLFYFVPSLKRYRCHKRAEVFFWFYICLSVCVFVHIHDRGEQRYEGKFFCHCIRACECVTFGWIQQISLTLIHEIYTLFSFFFRRMVDTAYHQKFVIPKDRKINKSVEKCWNDCAQIFQSDLILFF